MSEQASEFDPWGRRSVSRGDGDAFENMREQMEKERDAFFHGTHPRPGWEDNTAGRGGLFGRTRGPSFAGFPNSTLGRHPRYMSDLADDIDSFGNGVYGTLPGAGTGQGRNRKSSTGSGHTGEDDTSDQGSTGSAHSNHSGHSADTGDVPIRVLHERTAGPGKQKYGQVGRNTTELPAKSTGSESPRLERAHSEPPGKFKQRLNLANPLYSTIPENSEGAGLANRHMPQVEPKNPIKMSASAPSMPSSSHKVQDNQPVPPPRRSPPRDKMQQQYPQQYPKQQHQPPPPQQAGAGAVRHIPIFVEGRSQPIINTDNAAQGEVDPQQDMPFRKPSDYYPTGIQRIKSRDGTTPETPPFQNDPPFKTLRTGMPHIPDTEYQKPRVPLDEPTTPQGPPPGPIPMGYTPNHLETEKVLVEPTTPIPAGPGPIPMGCTPDLLGFPNNMPSKYATEVSQPESAANEKAPGQEILQQQDTITKPVSQPISAQVPSDKKPISAQIPTDKKSDKNPEPQPSVPNQKPPTTTVPKQEPIKKPSIIPNVPKQDHMKKPNITPEPAVNVIPIKVEHYGPQTAKVNPPAPPPRQPSPLPTRPSPTLSRKSPTPQPTPQKPSDPKIEKLQKVMAEIESLASRIDNFKGSKTDKEYLYLDEMMTRHLIALDGIEPEGRDDIRQLRKESIKSVNYCLSMLDKKVVENNTTDESNDILSDPAPAEDNSSDIPAQNNVIDAPVKENSPMSS